MLLATALTVCAFWSLRAENVVALVVQTRGPAQLIRGAVQSKLHAEQLLRSGDRVRTGRGARTDVQFSSGVICRIGPETSVLIEDLARGRARVYVKRGSYSASVSRGRGKYYIRVTTPTAIASVRGTEFIIEVQGEKSNIMVNKGEVNVSDSAGRTAVLVRAGQKVTAFRNKLRRAIMERFEKRKFKIMERLRKMRRGNFRQLLEQRRKKFEERRKEIRSGIRKRMEERKKRREHLKKKILE